MVSNHRCLCLRPANRVGHADEIQPAYSEANAEHHFTLDAVIARPDLGIDKIMQLIIHVHRHSTVIIPPVHNVRLVLTSVYDFSIGFLCSVIETMFCIYETNQDAK